MTSHGCGAARPLPPPKKRVGDMFCGAGGASLGFKRAAKKLRLQYELKAINHWEAAVKVHAANFPDAQHVCETIESIDPRELFPKGRLNLLIAAPECTDHSTAKGGRPVRDQRRASAWHILRWIELLYIDDLLIENVPEFVKWGPCNAKGKKIKSKAGAFFETFVEGLRRAGYTVEWRVLCAADYGDATTRKRLFIIARKRKPIVWPEATHAEHPTGRLKPWVPAMKIINWDKPGISIFRRHEYGLPPLKQTTIDRILEGIRRYGPTELYPFLVKFFQTNKVSSIRSPLGTVTAGGQHYGLCEPMVLPHRTFDNAGVDSIHRPLRTVTGTARDMAVAQPIIVQTDQAGSNGKCVRSAEEPAFTITSTGQLAVAYPWILPHLGRTRENRPQSVRKPLPTVTAAHGAGRLVQSVIVGTGGNKGAAKARPVTKPMKTVTTSNRAGVASAFMIEANHGDKKRRKGGRVHSVGSPMKTLTTSRGMALVSAFLDKYYGSGVAASVKRPLDTITVKPRFGLVEVCVGKKPLFYFDILFRMLDPEELAAAMGFPKGYFADTSLSKEDIVRMIGNAWPVHLGAALCETLLRN